MFCPKCGTKVSSNHKFCPKCGEKLIEDSHTHLHSINKFNTTENKFWHSWDKKKKIIFVIGVCCLGLIVIGAIGSFIAPDQNTSYYSNYGSSNDDSNSIDTSNSNSQNTNENDDGVGDADLQVRIIASGSWSGSVGTVDSTETITGSGSKIINLDGSGWDITSACIQKQNGDNSKLTVQIIKNGQIKKESSTTSPYGVVSVGD